MGIFDKFRRKRETPPENAKGLRNLAFVLLSEARLPNAAEIAQAFPDFAAPEESLETESDETAESASGAVISLKLNTGETAFVALMPAPVPNGEADNAARFSLSSFRNEWKLPPHCAHLIVTAQDAAESAPVVRLSRFTSLLAAVTKASPAVGVYWGNAGATHDSDFFISIASEREIVPRMMLWSGISVAREKDGRLSLLSLGMKQLNLPDLYLIAGSLSPAMPSQRCSICWPMLPIVVNPCPKATPSAGTTLSGFPFTTSPLREIPRRRSVVWSFHEVGPRMARIKLESKNGERQTKRQRKRRKARKTVNGSSGRR
jgi:hypothetical protein